jgi:major membrane immunogen (membrane-anchored lipoprotein)
MKTYTVFPLLAAALLLGACSTIDSRINEKSSTFYSLDEPTRSKIAHGDIAVGYTPDMVYMALGKPDAKHYRTTSDGTTETWSYGSYYDRYDGFASVGYHRWGGFGPRGFYRMYWEPAPFYNETWVDDIRVTFHDGKVITIDQART